MDWQEQSCAPRHRDSHARTRLSHAVGLSLPFVIHQDKVTHDFRLHCLLDGLDKIDLIVQHGDAILAYEKAHSIG